MRFLACLVVVFAIERSGAAQTRYASAPGDDGDWHGVTVPGGRPTLEALGVPSTQPRAMILTEIVRRLHFVSDTRRELEAAVHRLGGAAGFNGPAVTLPLPLSPRTWNHAVFERQIPASQLFTAIVADPAARLLYHGLMGLDAETRRWLGSQPALLQRLYGDADAVRAFALFASAIQVREGTVIIPGGELGSRRWTAVLGTDGAHAERFLGRLLTRKNGRLLGLYFTIAAAEPARQSYVLGGAGGGQEAFSRLASSFAKCYATELPEYPFTIRLADPALLLLELDFANGRPSGPAWHGLWRRALEGDTLSGNPTRDLTHEGSIDARWLVATLCDSPAAARPLVFETILFANRVFSSPGDMALQDILVALRGRRLYPGLMTALEQGVITAPSTYAVVARRAEQISRVADVRRQISALQQFQGAVALTLNAVRSRTLSAETGGRLLESLAAIGLDDGRYNGTLAKWFGSDLLPALTAGVATWSAEATPSVEERLIAALAGPPMTSELVSFEGLTYVVDLAGDGRRQLRQARQRQAAVPADTVMSLVDLIAELRAPALTVTQIPALRSGLGEIRAQLQGFRPAQEFGGDVPDVLRTLTEAERHLAAITQPRRLPTAREVAADLVPIVDFLFGHVLSSWAYAPHLDDAATGGDPSLRHEFGVSRRDRKITQRWEIAWRGDARGVSGALFGLEAALSRRVLRRLSVDSLPGPPVLDGNDVASLQLTAALSAPRQLTDDARARIAAALPAGAAKVEQAGRDAVALGKVAEEAAIGAWRTQALQWTAVETDEPLEGWFSSTELAWVGGLRPEEVDAWGTAFLGAGCLCLRIPRLRPPDAFVGRNLSAVRPYLNPGLMFRIAALLEKHQLPAALATAVQRYAMREVIDRVRPAHGGDLVAFARAIDGLEDRLLEDYIGAIAANGPLVAAEQGEE